MTNLGIGQSLSKIVFLNTIICDSGSGLKGLFGEYSNLYDNKFIKIWDFSIIQEVQKCIENYVQS